MFLEKRSGMEALRASTAHAAAVWKRLLRIRELSGAPDGPAVVDSTYCKPATDQVLVGAPFELPKVAGASRRITANILFYRYQRLQ